MCGIVGYVGERDCTDVLLDSLSKLEYRGYDSAGIAVFENGEITVEKAKGELKNLREKVAEHKPMGHCGIGHTRWAEYQLYIMVLLKTTKILRISLLRRDIHLLVKQIQKQ